MPHYRVELNGQNFLFSMDGTTTRFGFMTSRLVQAVDTSQAELSAVKLIRNDAGLAGALNERSDPPMIYCEGIEEVEPFDPASIVQLGLIFYSEEAES